MRTTTRQSPAEPSQRDRQRAEAAPARPLAATGLRTRVARSMRWGLTLATLAVAACSEPPLATVPASSAPHPSVIAAAEANATVYWNEVAREMVIANRASAAFAIRGYAIVSVAQYHAALAAEQGADAAVQPSIRAAIAGASVTALSYLFPSAAPELESLLEAFLETPGRRDEHHANTAAGVATGRAVGGQVVEYAKNDGFLAPGTLTPPVGPGYWYSTSPPAGALFGKARTFFLQSGDQFRPPPPPAFGSPEFLAALAEVRQISDTRTPEQVASARFWEGPAGTYTPAGFWNEEAAELALKYGLNQRSSAHLFALMNMVAYDGIVASHEAKYHYWLLRPTMADPGITLAIGLPNFPSYPSNHATISAGMARILGHAFPAELARLDALAEDAAWSRVLGGIHYRFDGDAGLTLGRQVAVWALARDVRANQPYPLR